MTLKKCPFCGGDAVLHRKKTASGARHWWASCEACGILTRFEPNSTAAKLKWNTRKEDIENEQK